MTTNEKQALLGKYRGRSLKDVRPDLAAEWHPTKNGDLTPDMVTVGSDKKVWWLTSYDDPRTGKHFDFEWATTVDNRVKVQPIPPFVTGRKVWSGFNDLETLRPDLAAEWHPTKNGDLTPEMVTHGSTKRVWWFLPYDDPKTGKHFDFEWEAVIIKRVNGSNCPYLSSHKIWIGFNDLATVNPNLAAQWHPTKNGDLTPQMVFASSGQKVWWYLPYDDPKTGKHFDFEWKSTINSRNQGAGCPFLSNQAAWPGFNDLETLRPDLAAEWHPFKNGDLRPCDVTLKSEKTVWWIYPYDDPNTGKHFDFEWSSMPAVREKGNSCPFLSGHAVWPGFNDLATVHPDLAAEWHPSKNGNLKPRDVSASSGREVWWLLPYDDPETGKHFDFEWKTHVYDRNNGSGCPFLSGQALWPGFNDLATTRPGLAAQWHPTKNGDLTPQMVFAGSGQKVWWYLPYDDPKTGKHFDFEWESSLNNRCQGSGCPFLSGHKAWPGFNDLETLRPDLAAEWHPFKNGDLRPCDVTLKSEKTVWWIYPYDDPNTGKHFDFEWSSMPAVREKGNSCPFLSGHAVWPGFNDLATLRPSLAAEWHPTKNGDLTPDTVTCRSGKKVWWKGKCGCEWRDVIYSRDIGCNCPFCGMTAGETRLFNFCKMYNLTSREQYAFNDCIFQKKLHFDRAVFDENGALVCLLEYDGEQHYKPVDFSGRGDAVVQFKLTKERDKIKNEYCRKNKIPLIRISYRDYDNIEKILLRKMVRYGLIR